MIDYMVMEAIYIKAQKEERDAEDQAKRKKWKQDTSELEQYR